MHVVLVRAGESDKPDFIRQEKIEQARARSIPGSAAISRTHSGVATAPMCPHTQEHPSHTVACRRAAAAGSGLPVVGNCRHLVSTDGVCCHLVSTDDGLTSGSHTGMHRIQCDFVASVSFQS